MGRALACGNEKLVYTFEHSLEDQYGVTNTQLRWMVLEEASGGNVHIHSFSHWVNTYWTPTGTKNYFPDVKVWEASDPSLPHREFPLARDMAYEELDSEGSVEIRFN